MFFFIFIGAVVFGFFCFYRGDPIKRRFFLILSFLFVVPFFSFSLTNWFSYFVCLLFLSGVFVILVYFSSLSKVLFYKKSLLFLVFFLLVFFVSFLVFLYDGGILGLNNFYWDLYLGFCFFLVSVLFFFINLIRFLLSWGGALRSF